LVREVATNRLSATIRHEEIPGYMPRMTMGLNVRDPKALDGVSAGDEVTFTLVATADEHWIENVRRTGRREEPKASQAPAAVAKPRELKPGDAMPDFEFMKEDGGRMRLSEFRGRSLAFTFFFTRCPIPEYCPRMAKGFAQARELLLKKPSESTNWQFLCLSFDADFDRPLVLAGYAKAYRGANPAGWMFGAVDSATLISVAPMLDLIVTQDTNGFSHNLRTVVLDPDGRIHRQFDGNEWTPAELVKAIEEAKGSGAK
jgi:protein SCO1/2